MIFLDALAAYVTAWLGAFSVRGRRLAPLTPRRLLFLLLAPLGLLLLLVHSIALAFDHLLYPGFRRITLDRAVFVVGVPRSGTTFLHRELAKDTRFTTTSTWEVLLAPAICERQVLRALGRLDQRFGGRVRYALDRWVRGAARDLQAVHEVGLDAEEEDYLTLLSAAGCFFAFVAFPQSSRLSNLGRLDKLPDGSRQRLLDHYHGLLQRHLYSHSGQRLLSKNAAFASWLPYLAERYPQAQFVICIREPATALSSQLSSLAEARRSFASFERDGDLADEFAALYEHWYRCLEEWGQVFGERAMVVDQARLRAEEQQVMSGLKQRLDMDCPDAPSIIQLQAPPAPSSGHCHDLASWPLDSHRLSGMTSSYRALLQLAEQPFERETHALQDVAL